MVGPDAAKPAEAKADSWYIEHPVWAIGACFGACVALAGLWAGVVYRYGPGAGPAESYALGTFGDAFGPIAALFNAAALAAALVAVVLQRRELAMQRDEMALAREEMKAQREEMSGQRDAAERHAKALEAANKIAADQVHETRQGSVATMAVSAAISMQAASASKSNVLAQVGLRIDAARLAFDAETWGAATAREMPGGSRIGEIREVAEYFRSGRPPIGQDMYAAQKLERLIKRSPDLIIALEAHAEATRMMELLGPPEAAPAVGPVSPPAPAGRPPDQ